jgi:hypothetical protein
MLACWKGPNNREWYLSPGASPVDDAGNPTQRRVFGEVGTDYQKRLFCRIWGAFINPSGFTCQLCQARMWPEAERWRAHLLPALLREKGKTAAEESLVDAVKQGRLNEPEAVELAHEYFPSA